MSARSNGIGVPDRAPVTQRPPKKESTFGKRSKGLRRSKPRRHINQADYLRCIGAAKARQGGRCVGLLAGIDHECDRMEWLHFVDQTVIANKLGEGSAALTDDRIGAYGCRWLNGSLDNWRGPLRNPELRRHLRTFAHPDFEEALVEYGLEVEADRKFNGAEIARRV